MAVFGVWCCRKKGETLAASQAFRAVEPPANDTTLRLRWARVDKPHWSRRGDRGGSPKAPRVPVDLPS